jgi:hypothetical protein
LTDMKASMQMSNVVMSHVGKAALNSTPMDTPSSCCNVEQDAAARTAAGTQQGQQQQQQQQRGVSVEVEC